MDIEKQEVEVNGVKLVLPIFTEKHFTAGLRRKTRNMEESRAAEEMLWILLEKFLTEEELDAWDSLSTEEFTEAMASGAVEVEVKK